MTKIDTREFRNALGAFATGVTVITTTVKAEKPGDPDLPVALTANSFSSVSLDPPLVLWSIARTAQSFDHFDKAAYFGVHILHSDQQGLSNICATKNVNKFAEIKWHPGVTGVPIFDDYNTCFECEIENRYEGGDHIIIVGRVHAFDNKQKDSHARPLLFYQGQYKSIA